MTFVRENIQPMTTAKKDNKIDDKDEIINFIEKKKTQNKALQKMMEQLENPNPLKEKNNTKQ